MAEALFDSPNVSRYASSIIKVNPIHIFEDLKIPILILDAVSNTDPIPVTTENRILKAKNPHLIKHIVFSNTDHNIHYTKPDEFLNAVKQFLIYSY
jgi:pimeloyl-ACP methyl ester carboxylesterase